jgi:hypothetical protein
MLAFIKELNRDVVQYPGQSALIEPQILSRVLGARTSTSSINTVQIIKSKKKLADSEDCSNFFF